MLTRYANKMITPPEVKGDDPRGHDFEVVTDGTLGGCGRGPVGDPHTWSPEVWTRLIERYKPESVLDVGCGYGYSTRWFEDVAGIFAVGIEGSPAVVNSRVGKNILVHDFRDGRPDFLADEYDLGWCCEFLEHVPALHEPAIFDALTHCRVVAMTAAVPGQGGHNHVNERPPRYWVERFAAHGFRADEEMTNELRQLAHDADPLNYFARNGIVFVREKKVDAPPSWTDFPGCLTDQQGIEVQRRASGKRVLYMGDIPRAMMCLAGVARQVTHWGVSGDWPDGFHLDSKVEPFDGEIADLASRRFDVVVVDSPASPESLARLALECLLPGGCVIWTDFDDPDVRAGIAAVGVPVDQLTDLDGLGILQTARDQVAVCLPHTGAAHVQAVKMATQGCAGKLADQVAFIDMACGSLTHNFNAQLAHCLAWRDAGKVTHLAMIHSDISADPGWVDILAEEMSLLRATAISAVVAIKDPDDDRTSTAIGRLDDPWDVARYIRRRDHGRIPETFTGADVCGPGEVLLINTGCMLLDLRDSFWDDCDGSGTPFAFRIFNRVGKAEDGKRWPQFRPEDWEMSRELHAAGRTYASTFKVLTRHHGHDTWDNRPRIGLING